MNERPKYTIRGTKEGLWFEVIKLSDKDNPNTISSESIVAEFEIEYSKEKKKFVLKKILFKDDLSKEEKKFILEDVKDFVLSLNP